MLKNASKECHLMKKDVDVQSFYTIKNFLKKNTNSLKTILV